MGGNVVWVLLWLFSPIAWAAIDCSTQTANAASPVTYSDVASIFKTRCATCHFGASLDLSAFPFVYYKMDDQKSMVEEFVRRMNLPEEDWDRMPARNGISLTRPEIELIERWLADGLQVGAR